MANVKSRYCEGVKPCDYQARVGFRPTLFQKQTILTYNLRAVNLNDCIATNINTQIDVYHHTGHKVTSITDLSIKESFGEIPLDTADWQKGVYIIRMQVGKQLFIGRGVKL